MTEKELEQLFKEKLENRQFEFNPSNWGRMENMLDRKQPAGGFFWGSTAAIVVFGLLMSAIIYLQGPIAPTDPVSQSLGVEDTSTNIVLPEEGTSNKIQNSQPLESRKTQGSTPTAKKENNGVSNPLAENSGESPTAENINEAPLGFVDPLELDFKKPAFKNNPEVSLLAAPVTFTPEALRKYQSKNEFYIRGGAIFSGSYNSNNPGMGWQAGIGYQRRITGKWLLNVSLNYAVQNNIGIVNYTDTVFYTFGKETIETEVNNRRLDYIEIPVSLGYDLNEKHSVGAGAYIAMLTNVNREVNRKTYATKRATEVNTREVKGYQEEFNRFDFGLQIGYSYSISPDFKVSLCFSQGLKDITKNTGGEYKRTHSNRSTRVVFSYNLFKE